MMPPLTPKKVIRNKPINRGNLFLAYSSDRRQTARPNLPSRFVAGRFFRPEQLEERDRFGFTFGIAAALAALAAWYGIGFASLLQGRL